MFGLNSLLVLIDSYHCCAVLQNDVLYLTSDKRNEEVPVECIETVIVNSKRIGHENGVQLTYRANKKGLLALEALTLHLL